MCVKNHGDYRTDRYIMDLQKSNEVMKGHSQMTSWNTTTGNSFKGHYVPPGIESKITDFYAKKTHFEFGREPIPQYSTTKEAYKEPPITGY